MAATQVASNSTSSSVSASRGKRPRPQRGSGAIDNPSSRALLCAVLIPHSLEVHNLGDVFDQHDAAMPVADRDVTRQTVFVDPGHLDDPANEIIIIPHLAGFIR